MNILQSLQKNRFLRFGVPFIVSTPSNSTLAPFPDRGGAHFFNSDQETRLRSNLWSYVMKLLKVETEIRFPVHMP